MLMPDCWGGGKKKKKNGPNAPPKGPVYTGNKTLTGLSQLFQKCEA